MSSVLKVGDKFFSDTYGNYTVVEYTNFDNVLIVFERTNFKTKSTARRIRKGQVRDHKQQLVFGVGYSYSEKYTIRAGGRKSPQYGAWENMLARCYYSKTSRYSAYGEQGVKVCDEWLVYENFAEWYDQNYLEFHHLDKDLLGDGKLYSPKTCCYIPQKLNSSFVVKSKNSRSFEGCLPAGVSYSRGRFVTSVDRERRSFSNKEDANKDYIVRKCNSIRRLATGMYHSSEITERIYLAVMNKYDYESKGIMNVFTAFTYEN